MHDKGKTSPTVTSHEHYEIDRVLTRHYGFTDEECDFMIDYDIKYRMGRDANADEENGDE